MCAWWVSVIGVIRDAVLTDAQWSLIEPLLPCSDGVRGRPFRDHRQVIEGSSTDIGLGVPWRDLPADFGPWQTVWKRHRRFAGDGTWDWFDRAAGLADAAGGLDWSAVAVDSTSFGCISMARPCRARHRGHHRITRICAMNPPITLMGRSRGGLRRRSISSATGGAGRWWC